MSQPKIRIKFNSEENNDRKKLQFSPQSREEARKRLKPVSEEGKSSEHKIHLVRPPIYDQLFETPMEQERKQQEVAHDPEEKQESNFFKDFSFQDNDSLATEFQDSERKSDHSKTESNDDTHYPQFPGVYPTIWRPEDKWIQPRDWRKPPEWRDESEDNDDLIHLGPIYDEERDTEKHKKSSRSKSIISLQPAKFKTRRKPWMRLETTKMIGSILGAIALGSLFGYLLLMLLINGNWFKSEESLPGNTETSDAPATTNVIPSSQVQFDLSKGGKSAAAAGFLQVSDRTFYAIQGGVFTELSSAQAAVEGLEDKGVPSLILNEDTQRLFLGIAYKREDALDLAGYYQGKVPEIYLKEFIVPGGTILVPGAQMTQMQVLNDFFTHGTYLLEKTAAWIGDGVSQNVNTNQMQGEWDTFKDTHRKFLEESKVVMDFLPEDQQKWVDQMKSNMNLAVTGMVEYLQKPDTSYLLQTQQALLNYFNGYREFLRSAGISVTTNQ